MKLLIEIPDRFVKDRDGIFIDDVYKATPEIMDAFFESILKGTPLPEHHGDLKDVSKLVYDCSYDNGNGCDRICHCDDCNYHVVRESDIKALPTIIPATKEKQTERKCESCKYHDGRGGCLDSCALCRYTPKQTATKEKSCATCGQPKNHNGDCILYMEGKCVERYEKWKPATKEDEYIIKKNPNMIEIPDNAINGDVIKALFKDRDLSIIQERLEHTHWWNAKYKAEGEDKE